MNETTYTRVKCPDTPRLQEIGTQDLILCESLVSWTMHHKCRILGR